MELNQVVPLTTREGFQYLIEFYITDEIFKLPETVDTKIANVGIILVEGEGMNNPSTLFLISDIIRKYLDENNVILYCYCDNKEIFRNVNKSKLSPQQYRSNLFIRMFERVNDKSYINHTIVINDKSYGDHYIHLISKNENREHIENIEGELSRMHK